MPEFSDQLNNTILLEKIPKRIVCLVPSITELLVDLDLRDNIIGITKFCVEPNDLRSNCKLIGGTKNVNVDLINKLKPDLIIANKEENLEETISLLKRNFPVWVSNVKTLDDNYDLIIKLSEIFDKKDIGNTIILKTKEVLKELKLKKEIQVLYLIWKNPFMSIGQDTFIFDILKRLGITNIIKENRYPIVDINNNYEFDFLFLSSEPYPFNNKDCYELEQNFPNKKTLFVRGDCFSWYGSRISKSKDYFKNLINILNKTTYI